MSIGIVPDTIQLAIIAPTQTITNKEGKDECILSAMPCSISFQVYPTLLAMIEAIPAARISKTCMGKPYLP